MLIQNKEEIKKELQPTMETTQVLGAIIKKPSLIKDKTFNLSVTDFYQHFHKVIFSAAYNLVTSGVNELDEFIIDNYLQQHSANWKKIFDDNNGLEYIKGIIKIANLPNYIYNCNKVKKFALLRDLLDSGIDIGTIYDKNNPELMVQFDRMTSRDLLNQINLKMLDVKHKWHTSSEDTYNFQAGDGLKELKERLKTTPSVGYPFSSAYLTSIVRGMRKKKFILRSSNSGGGKSRQAMADSVNLGVPFIYDVDIQQWKLNGTSEGVLYISTELEKEEVQTCFLAYLSGVPEGQILDGFYSSIEEEERVNKAIELLEKANIQVEYIPDFDSQDIEDLIEKHIIKHNIEYVFFDYIHVTPKMLYSSSKSTGMRIREDQVLFLFANSLKQLANRYNVFISSSTQLNRGYKDDGNLDAGALRGAFSLADKLDVGIISLPVTPKELENLEPILRRMNFGQNIVPTMSHTIYKNRGNKYKNIRIWTDMNLDIVRERDLFVTDMDYNLIPIEKLNIVLEEDEELKLTLEYLNSDVMTSNYEIPSNSIDNNNIEQFTLHNNTIENNNNQEQQSIQEDMKNSELLTGVATGKLSLEQLLAM